MILYSQRALFNVIIFIIPIIISINLSKFLKIQTNKMACKPNRLRSACALVHADSKDSDQTMSILRLIGVLAVCSCICQSKLGYLPIRYDTVLFCENTDQTIIKCRCDAGCSYHLTLNLLVSSADKLFKKF